jgi:hypothetical protein
MDIKEWRHEPRPDISQAPAFRRFQGAICIKYSLRTAIQLQGCKAIGAYEIKVGFCFLA